MSVGSVGGGGEGVGVLGGAGSGGGGVLGGVEASAVLWRGEHLGRMAPSAVFESPSVGSSRLRFNSGAYSASGSRLAVVCDQGALSLVNAVEGRVVGHVRTSLGMRAVTFSHEEGTVLYGANSMSPDRSGLVAAHAVEPNEIVQLFRGHSAAVTSVAVSPVADWFATGSLDGSFRIWDPRVSSNAIAAGKPGTVPLVAIDPSGQVLLVAGRRVGCTLFDTSHEGGGGAEMYDMRKLSAGPFQSSPPTFDPWKDTKLDDMSVYWSHGSFSADGSLIALSATNVGTCLLDAFSLQQLHVFPTPKSTSSSSSTTPSTSTRAAHCFSADGALLFLAGADGTVQGVEVHALAKAVAERAETDATTPLPIPKPPATLNASKLKEKDVDEATTKHPSPVLAVTASPTSASLTSISEKHAVLWGLGK